MVNILWIAGALLGIVTIWFLLKVIMGYSLPPETTGKAYLRKRLQNMGIGRDTVSDECVSDLVTVAIDTATAQKMLGRNFSETFVSGLDTMADMVHLWIHNPSDMLFQPVAGEKGLYREIFERHNVPTVQN